MTSTAFSQHKRIAVLEKQVEFLLIYVDQAMDALSYFQDRDMQAFVEKRDKLFPRARKR